MKKAIVFMMSLWIAMFCMGAFAEEAEDSEAALRRLLSEECGTESLRTFAYGDYDGDGVSEAFALVGDENDWGITGDLWFVSPLFAEKIQEGKSYSKAEKIGEMTPMLFRAEESYGGSGSTSYLWRVQNGAPVSMNASLLENFSYSGHGYDFYSYPSAFDACDDGTGHTWKPYYFYLDAETMQIKEYGGLYVSRRDLEAYAGAAEALQSAEAEGYEVWEMIYRENGLVNVNLHSSDGCNNFLTLKLSDGAAIDVTPSENAGYYLLASEPDLAVYPMSMSPGNSNPAVSEAEPAISEAESSPSASESAPSSVEETKSLLVPEDGPVYRCDLDGDGIEEQIQVACYPTKEYTSYWLYIADAEGVLLGGDEVLQVWDEEYVHGLTAYAFRGGLYLEARESGEGTRTDYMIFSPENGAYVLKKWIYDADPSEGDDVGDALLGVSLLYTEISPEVSMVIPTLESAFSEYDLHFRSCRFNHFESQTAELSQDALIFDLYDDAFPFYAVILDPFAETSSAPASAATASPQTFTATGDVNMRDVPNLAGKVLTTVKKGGCGEYLGEQSTDERGVVWYFVRFNGHTGWVSSKYARLN